jgi:hypothetical protein
MLKIFSAIRAVYIDGGGGGLGGFHSLYSLGGKVPAMPEGLAYPAIRMGTILVKRDLSYYHVRLTKSRVTF